MFELCFGNAKASSARASVTLCLMSLVGCVFDSRSGSNANLLPESWSREKSSRAGNLAEASSRELESRPLGVRVESSAAQGSLLGPLLGEGLGLGACASPSAFVGLPRLIGVMSGMARISSTIGARNAPTDGGEATLGSAGGRCWLRLASD